MERPVSSPIFPGVEAVDDFVEVVGGEVESHEFEFVKVEVNASRLLRDRSLSRIESQVLLRFFTFALGLLLNCF